MAKDDMAKENAKQLKAEEALKAERLKAGWIFTEWGEFVPPVVEIDNNVDGEPKTTEVTQNSVQIPAPATKTEEE